jgi:hypothetical protein
VKPVSESKIASARNAGFGQFRTQRENFAGAIACRKQKSASSSTILVFFMTQKPGTGVMIF